MLTIGVHAGRETTVYVEALNVDIPGQVPRISPLASTMGGDVVYTVVVALEELPGGLRLGMSAEVELATGSAAVDFPPKTRRTRLTPTLHDQ